MHPTHGNDDERGLNRRSGALYHPISSTKTCDEVATGSGNVRKGIGGSESGSSGTSAGQSSPSTALILKMSREAFAEAN